MDTNERQELAKDFTLSTGRVVKHSYMDNGAQEATPIPGNPEFTEPEWQEYCAYRVFSVSGK